MSENGSVKPVEYPKDNGYGRFWTEKNKKKPTSPDKTGNFECMGEYLKISIWINSDGSETIKTRPMTPVERENYLEKKRERQAKAEAEANRHTDEIRQKIEPPKPTTPMPDPNIDDEIPF